MLFRPATEADLDELVRTQEAAAVVALAHVFPQETHPFPRESVLGRWRTELHDPAVAVYVSTDDVGRITGFAARKGDELLHFGTSISMWGTGLADALHDALVETYPCDLDRIWLRVFEANHRARRFWEKKGWRPSGRRSRSSFAPHPVLAEYVLDLRTTK
ncbi:MAG: GNAT family protein [Nocardioides sp.]